MKNHSLNLSILLGIVGSVASFIISGYIYFVLNAIGLLSGTIFCGGIIGLLGSIIIKHKPRSGRIFMLLSVLCIMGISCFMVLFFLPIALSIESIIHLHIASLGSIPIALFIAARALSYRREEEGMKIMMASAMGKAGSITFLFFQIIALALYLSFSFLSINYGMIMLIAMRLFYILLGISGLIGAFKVIRTPKTGGVLMLIAGSVICISWVWGIIQGLINHHPFTVASIGLDTAVPMLFLLSAGILALINSRQVSKV